jgi:hypothetical protein
MPGALGPRFVAEAVFLILLAVGAGLADLTPRTIVIVMAVAWALVALLEWSAWREASRYVEQPWRVERDVVDPYVEVVAPAVQPPEALTQIVPASQLRPRRRFLRRRRVEEPQS